MSVFTNLFPALLQIMEEVEQQGLKGGQLLNLLFDHCQSGNPLLKNMFSKILHCCHQVFFH